MNLCFRNLGRVGLPKGQSIKLLTLSSSSTPLQTLSLSLSIEWLCVILFQGYFYRFLYLIPLLIPDPRPLGSRSRKSLPFLQSFPKSLLRGKIDVELPFRSRSFVSSLLFVKSMTIIVNVSFLHLLPDRLQIHYRQSDDVDPISLVSVQGRALQIDPGRDVRHSRYLIPGPPTCSRKSDSVIFFF